MISDFDVILKISLIKDHQYPRLIERSRRVSGLMIEMKQFIDKKMSTILGINTLHIESLE